MSSPLVLRKDGCNSGQGTFAPIVESHKQGTLFHRISRVSEIGGCDRRRIADLGDRRQMGIELKSVQFVFGRARTAEAAGVPVASLDDIVIEQADNSQSCALLA